MSILYPRLLPNETERLFSSMRGLGLDQLRERARTSSARAVYAATGGTRVTRDELRLLAGELEQIARANGFPNSMNLKGFDPAVAQHLHRSSGMTPGEASQRQVWAFLALVLVPHVCGWRFPVKADGTYTADRFKRIDLDRHTPAALLLPADVLHDPAAADPFGLLLDDRIGEADLDQIMARRRALGATPALVRAIVRAHIEDEGRESRAVLRDSLQRLLRLTAFLDLDWMPEEHLLDLVRDLRVEARKYLAVT